MTDPHGQDVRGLAVRWLKMIQCGDFSEAREILDDNIIAEWPQSRERVRGLNNLIGIFTNYPGGVVVADAEKIRFKDAEDSYLMTPMFTMVKAQASGDTATGSILTRYPDGSDWYIVMFITAKEGKIVYNEVFFAPVYDAPEWRKQWVETMDDD
jgi:hypothetical protein